MLVRLPVGRWLAFNILAWVRFAPPANLQVVLTRLSKGSHSERHDRRPQLLNAAHRALFPWSFRGDCSPDLCDDHCHVVASPRADPAHDLVVLHERAHDRRTSPLLLDNSVSYRYLFSGRLHHVLWSRSHPQWSLQTLPSKPPNIRRPCPPNILRQIIFLFTGLLTVAFSLVV
jgi:hypothetical protein